MDYSESDGPGGPRAAAAPAAVNTLIVDGFGSFGMDKVVGVREKAGANRSRRGERHAD
jgi:hypothetical protein